jgi:hypothetical protein
LPGGILQQDVRHYPAPGKHIPCLIRFVDLLAIGKTGSRTGSRNSSSLKMDYEEIKIKLPLDMVCLKFNISIKT